MGDRCCFQAASGPRHVERRFGVGSVSSPMREAAARLPEAVSVSSPPHCGRKTQSVPTVVLADDATPGLAIE